MIALPRVETAARELLFALGDTLFELQVRSRAGRYPTLSWLLDRLLERGLNESWHRYLDTLLTSPGIGWNLRNDRLHGLSDDEVSSELGALVLVAVLYLAFVEPATAEGIINIQ